jgi:hypothetical protein
LADIKPLPNAVQRSYCISLSRNLKKRAFASILRRRRANFIAELPNFEITFKDSNTAGPLRLREDEMHAGCIAHLLARAGGGGAG